MASSIVLSDNGVTSGSAGIKSTGGNDGVLLLQTTTAGGVATTAVTISNTQVVTFANPPTATGGGSVSTNTAYGTSALSSNTTGSQNTGIGPLAGFYNATGIENTFVGYSVNGNGTGGSAGSYNTAIGRAAMNNNYGSYNTAVGNGALQSNTSASNNTAVGYQAGYTNTTGNTSTFVGHQAGYTSNNTATYSGNTCLGYRAGYSLTTGVNNTFVGGLDATNNYASGSLITTGSKNTIIGNYSGNQGSLDIRTLSNYIVLSDGDGNPRARYAYSSASSGNFTIVSNSTTDSTNATFSIQNSSGTDVTFEAGNNSIPGISGVFRVAKYTTTSRSINAAGTINQNGADYAEYMVKSGDFTVAKGDLVGINAEGKITKVFADAISFCVKSTDPGLVGGDNWFTEPRPKDESGNEVNSGTQEYIDWFSRMEAARSTVDRIAFCGQVPVNVTGATAGQYIVPVNDDGAIKGEAVSNPTFEQYQQAVGKVIAIEQDGRARIIVKVA
jgi:hypothetical protein